MATTAPGTRSAAISRAKKASIRARPSGEKPALSGGVVGSGVAARAAEVSAARLLERAKRRMEILWVLSL